MARNRKSTVTAKPPKQEAVFMTVNEDGDCTGLYESVEDASGCVCEGERLFIYELSLEGRVKKARPSVIAVDGTVFEDFDTEEDEEV